MLWQLTYRSLDDLFGDVVGNLYRSKQLLLETADVAHYAAAHDARIILYKRYEAEAEAENHRRNQVVQDWIAAAGCEDIHNSLRERRTNFPGTAIWIHKHEAFARWIKEFSTEKRIFWLSGIPGAGKRFSTSIQASPTLTKQAKPFYSVQLSTTFHKRSPPVVLFTSIADRMMTLRTTSASYAKV